MARHRRSRRRRTPPRHPAAIRMAGIVVVGSVMLAGVALTTGAVGVQPGDTPTVGAVSDSELPTTTELQPMPVGAHGNDWSLVFDDGFDGDALDTSVWTTCFWWDQAGCTNLSTNEQQWYLPAQVTVDDGRLGLVARPGPVVGLEGREFPYVSGMVSTGRASPDRTATPGFAFTYGYVEMRARVPAGSGLWPAFWLLPVTHDSKPEIDVMEVLGHDTERVAFHFHWRDFQGDARQVGGSWRAPDLSAGWHIYAVEWNEEEVRWFVDGVERWAFRIAGAVPDEPMYLLANLAVGGEFAGEVDEAALPATFAIDYVRVWQRSD